MGDNSTILERMYVGPVKRVADAVGIRDQLVELNLLYYRVLTNGIAEIQIGDITAEFTVSNRSEYQNVRDVESKERPIVERLLAELRSDDVFWDVGANIGTFSCLAGKVLTDGTVVAFEPYPPNVESLRENLDANGITSIVEAVALSDSDGETTFFALDTDEPGMREGSIETEYAATDRAVDHFTVPTRTGDGLVSDGEIPAPTVVKMDVEGAAPAVIDGMEETLTSARCRLVIVEPHANRVQVEAMLDRLGFELEVVDLDGAVRIIGSSPD